MKLTGSFAYSVLTRFADGTAGCLFEADNNARIAFALPARLGAGKMSVPFHSTRHPA